MDKRPTFFKHKLPITWSDIGFTLAVIAFGVVLMVWTDVADKYLIMAIGGLAALVGLVRVIRYFMRKGKERLESNDFASGLSCIALGVLLIVGRSSFSALLVYLFGLVLMVCAAYQIQSALRLKYMKVDKWYLHLIAVVISLTFGIVIIAVPTMPAWTVGLALVVEGVLYALSRILFIKNLDSFSEEPKQINEPKEINNPEE